MSVGGGWSFGVLDEMGMCLCGQELVVLLLCCVELLPLVLWRYIPPLAERYPWIAGQAHGNLIVYSRPSLLFHLYFRTIMMRARGGSRLL